jgi:hypothetical protein
VSNKIIALLALTALASVTFAQGASQPHIAYTYQNGSGNRYLPDAAGTFPDVRQLDVQLDAVPAWVVGGLVNGAPTWTVALVDGRVLAVDAIAGADDVSGLMLQIGQVAPQQPIAAVYDGQTPPQLLTVSSDIAPLSAPVAVDSDAARFAYVASNGDLVLIVGGDAEAARQPLNIQQDAQIVVSDDGLIAVYTQAGNDRYVHGIMGDDIEGAGLAILDGETLEVLASVTLPESDVFEGLSPFWADVDNDGTQDIITTPSNGQVGAWVRAYTAGGEILAESRAIGQGFRWRHQLAAAPFGINSEFQIVDVLTPHIGGMVEFFDYTDGELVVNNAQLGYTSHLIGSRNLDQGVAADFNGNGKPELVITDPARQNVTALENTTEGVQEVWRLPLDDTLYSNFAAVQLPDGTLALAAGTTDGRLRVWLPR